MRYRRRAVRAGTSWAAEPAAPPGQRVPAPRRSGDHSAHDAAPQPVQDLLAEVAQFRLALTADLVVAAAALEQEEPEVAGQVVDAGRRDLHDFQRRMLGQLAGLDQPSGRGRFGVRAMLGVGLLAAAAGAGAAGTTLALVPTGATAPVAAETPAERAQLELADFSRTAARPGAGADEVITAARALNAAVATLMPVAGTDRLAALAALSLLDSESQLVQATRPAGGDVVLAEEQRLRAQLSWALPPVPPPSVLASAAPSAHVPDLADPLPGPAAVLAPAPAAGNGQAASPTPSRAPSTAASPALPRPTATTSTPSPARLPGPPGPQPTAIPGRLHSVS